MDGLFFYWFAWIGWVFCTFMMDKKPSRFQIASLLLILILFSGMSIGLDTLKVNVAFIILIVASYSILGSLSFYSFVYHMFSSIILSLGYVGFYLLALYDPVWLLLDIKWSLAGTIFLISLFLVNHSAKRVLTIIIGFCHGEIIYSVIILNLNPLNQIGSFFFLDSLAIGTMLGFGWLCLETLAQRLHISIDKTVFSKKGFMKGSR